jgi:CheY-like chemotaxis protein
MAIPSVIIADTDRDLRSALRVQLDALGFTSFVAVDAREAVERASSQTPRLVLLDVSLPRLGAFEACARIRRLPDCHAVPIMLITLLDRPQVRAAAARAGATRVLVKPFSLNDLLRELEPLVDAGGPIPWPGSPGVPAPVPSGMAEPARRVWGPPPVRTSTFVPQASTLAQGLHILDVVRSRETKRGPAG